MASILLSSRAIGSFKQITWLMTLIYSNRQQQQKKNKFFCFMVGRIKLGWTLSPSSWSPRSRVSFCKTKRWLFSLVVVTNTKKGHHWSLEWWWYNAGNFPGTFFFYFPVQSSWLTTIVKGSMSRKFLKKKFSRNFSETKNHAIFFQSNDQWFCLCFG